MYPAFRFTCLAFIRCSIVCLQAQTDAIIVFPRLNDLIDRPCYNIPQGRLPIHHSSQTCNIDSMYPAGRFHLSSLYHMQYRLLTRSNRRDYCVSSVEWSHSPSVIQHTALDFNCLWDWRLECRWQYNRAQHHIMNDMLTINLSMLLYF